MEVAIKRILLLVLLLLGASAASVAAARPLPPVDRFSLALGGYANSLGLEGRFDGSVERSGTRLDFSEGFELDERQAIGLASIEWNPLERHQLHVTVFEDRRRQTASFAREIVFEDVVFPLEAELVGRFRIRAIDAGYTFWAWRTERSAGGIGLGVFDYSARLALTGRLRRNGDIEPLVEETAVASDRLRVPVLSASWRRSLSDRWRVRADASALEIGWDGIDGDLYRLQVLAEYYPWRHVGFSLGYAHTLLQAKAERERLRGELELEFSGVQGMLRIRF